MCNTDEKMIEGIRHLCVVMTEAEARNRVRWEAVRAGLGAALTSGLSHVSPKRYVEVLTCSTSGCDLTCN